MKRPNNWYGMSYHQQQEWEALNQESERRERQAQYDLDQANDEAASARRKTKAAEIRVNAAREELDCVKAELSEAQEEIARLRGRVAQLQPGMKLTIETTGDKSVGIQPYRVVVDFGEDKMVDSEFRKSIRKALVEMVSAMWDEPIRFAVFSDECADCCKLKTECKCNREDAP